MKNNQILKGILSNFCIVIFIFLLDRLSKHFILKFFETSIKQEIEVYSFLKFNLLWNNGIAFGLLQVNHIHYYNLITILILMILIFVTWIAFKSKGLEKISYLIILGGGLGNIFDRLYYGSVIDFIDISYKNFHWFIFNVADIFITLGVFILIYREFKKKNV